MLSTRCRFHTSTFYDGWICRSVEVTSRKVMTRESCNNAVHNMTSYFWPFSFIRISVFWKPITLRKNTVGTHEVLGNYIRYAHVLIEYISNWASRVTLMEVPLSSTWIINSCYKTVICCWIFNYFGLMNSYF